MGNEPIKTYTYSDKGAEAGMYLISKLILEHWDNLQATFSELNEEQKNEYEVQLHKVHKDLGKAFTSGDKEEFEQSITDMAETEPLINALTEMKIIQLTEEEQKAPEPES